MVEKEASAESFVKLQSEFDIQKNLLAETTKKLDEIEKLSKEMSQKSHIIQRNYEEAIANKEREIGLLKQVSSDLESKIFQQDTVLEELKKNKKGLLGLPGFSELPSRKDAGKQGFGLPVLHSGENDKVRRTLNSLANALTKGLGRVSPQTTSFINKLRFGKISEKELDHLKMLLLEEHNSGAGQDMVGKLISEARQILFQSK